MAAGLVQDDKNSLPRRTIDALFESGKKHPIVFAVRPRTLRRQIARLLIRLNVDGRLTEVAGSPDDVNAAALKIGRQRLMVFGEG